MRANDVCDFDAMVYLGSIPCRFSECITTSELIDKNLALVFDANADVEDQAWVDG